ncbi:Uncharacterised protein [Salmonella enterica subsp. enterica serovar Bovismorbificans]|nr:Uncharacterised protein [Salmonella enterica subsp. enterica serovar Bovismorbificans]
MQTAKRAGAGIEIAGDGDRHLIAAQQFNRRALRLAQKIKRAGQQHADSTAVTHRRDARFIKIFDMIRR